MVTASLMASDKLDGQCSGLTATDAQAGNATLAAAGFQGVNHRDHDARAAGADGMAHGDGAAVDVDLVVRQVGLFVRRPGDVAPGRVDFPAVASAGLPAG